MTALRIRARDLMTEQELIKVRTRSTWKSVALIAHAWTLIPASACEHRLASTRVGDPDA
jgi:hypothetical protein